MFCFICSLTIILCVIKTVQPTPLVVSEPGRYSQKNNASTRTRTCHSDCLHTTQIRISIYAIHRVVNWGSYPDLLSKVPPSWMTDQVKLRCHGQMNKLLSPSIVHYKSDFVWTDRLNPLNAPRQRPDITRNKIWNQLINHNILGKRRKWNNSTAVKPRQ